MWSFYMRTYEILWSLERESLAGVATLEPQIEADAQLAARLVRHYARDWLPGAGRYAALERLVGDRRSRVVEEPMDRAFVQMEPR